MISKVRFFHNTFLKLHIHYVRSLCQNVCISILWNLLCKISAIFCARNLCQNVLSRTICARSQCADLVHISIRISASGSCVTTTCARSLYADLWYRILVSGCSQQDPVEPFVVQDLCFTISCARSLFRISASRSLQDYLQKTLPLHKPNFISTSRNELHNLCRDTSPRVALRNQKSPFHQHSALDTHDLRRKLHFKIKKCHFACIQIVVAQIQ